MPKIIDPDLLVVGTELTLDTSAKTITLNVAGNLIAKDGVTLQALYSKLILLWETSAYNKFPFPMYTIDAKSGQFIFGFDGGTYNGWKPANDPTRTYLRDGGWEERSAAAVLNRQYVGIVSLGTVNSGSQLYYQRASIDAPSNFTFVDAANEGIQVFGDATNGNFDKRTFFKGYVREYAFKYKDSVLADTGQTATGAYTVNMLLSNDADLDVVATDAYVTKSQTITAATWATGVVTFTSTAHGYVNGDIVVVSGVSPAGYNRHGVVSGVAANTFNLAIAANPGAYVSGGLAKSHYDKIGVRYFSGAYSKDVDSTTDRNFGVVVDAGTHSGIDGSMTAAGAVLTSAAGGIDTGGYFSGATVRVHEGTNAGLYTVASVTATTITITGTFAATEANSSFTLIPAGGLGATLKHVYTKVQYLLRQNSDIDLTAGSVTGKTGSLLLNFVGSRLDCGFFAPANPNGGGTGVMVEGVSNAETNSIRFFDNIAVQREYPFSSSGTLNFNSFLTAGGTGYYRMYFTALPGAGDDYGEASAVTVNDAGALAIAGTISSGAIGFTFDYTNNVQGGRTAGTDANFTLVAGNKGSAKPVVVTGSITQSKTINVTATAEQDRAYSNP